MHDLIVIGGGPAGLSAAINGASEGLDVLLMDNGASGLGGQAKESAAIENYPGFPDGVTGEALMHRLVRQAHKFQTEILCPHAAAALEPIDGGFSVTTEDYLLYQGRTVLLAMGLSYRRLHADNISHYMGRGVYYGVPAGVVNRRKTNYAVIGGANSAGQAVLNLAQNSSASVKLIIRKTIGTQMSQYLVERITAQPNIEVCELCEVKACYGKTFLEEILVTQDGRMLQWPVSQMFIFIGAFPRTLWLRGTLKMDEKGFIWDGQSATPLSLPYETSLPGVFVAGDVRAGSTKRIATAIGEGAAALQVIHRRLKD